MPSLSKRDELARFLRSRRERLTPADVGLPVGGRRRTAGLRREEVAVLAGVSPTWYTYLEQGRSIRPSREVIQSLGAVLRFSDDEQAYVRTLVEGSVVPAPDPSTRASAVELLGDVVAQYDDGPFPLYATDFLGDLIAWNRAACEWYDDWDALAAEERNILRWLLTSPRAKERIVDWAEVTRDAVARWRAECAHHTSEQVQRRVEEFTELSPEFSDWWLRHDVLEHRHGVRRFRHFDLEQEMIIVPLFPPELRSYGLIFHVPSPA